MHRNKYYLSSKSKLSSGTHSVLTPSYRAYHIPRKSEIHTILYQPGL